MKKIVIGIVAHVDAGKTTLSEGMLYLAGAIRKLGRVDNGDAFLDTFSLERARGITIFSKLAKFTWKDTTVTLLDTPGHVDFSAEMERTLQVLDYAILVISGADGVQGHTKTLWSLLEKYKIPTFLFINKMDQQGTNKDELLGQLQAMLSDGCMDFTNPESEEFYENVAMCSEDLLEQYMEQGAITTEQVTELIKNRKIFPCFFGAALKLEGVEAFLDGLETYTVSPQYGDSFGAKIYKIARDEQGNRLTYLKVTGGTLRVKMALSSQEEKINQIRIYSGVKYDAVMEAEAGTICAVTGLTTTKPGEGVGIEKSSMGPILSPVLTYEIQLPSGCDPNAMLPKLRILEEEEPELHIVWDEELQEIQAQIMGEVQIEILRSMIATRFGIDVTFGNGNIVYKETITDVVEGVGHFEPLRHYAEVHLLLEPGEPGSGLVFESNCSEDELDRNWQRLIRTHLEEKEHRGVLAGCSITDMKITLVGGRAHQKHTEGGDFRQATYRAIRQGLRQATSVLLEPYFHFQLEVPEKMVGRAMTDLERMQASFEMKENKNGISILEGKSPVVTMRDYQKDVVAYTSGHGRLFCELSGYEPCHNQEEVLARFAYDPEADLANPTGSVFCAHGAGFLVSWDQVPNYMHVESYLMNQNKELRLKDKEVKEYATYQEERFIDTDEIDAILNRTFYSNSGSKERYYTNRKKEKTYEGPVVRNYKKTEKLEEYLLVDGYNIIFAWEELNQLAKINMDGARNKLQDTLCNYQAIKRCNLIVVFDAYRVEGHRTEIMDYHNIHVVFTKEAETADQYIEKFSHENSKKYDITVATSDGVEQVIIRGQGCRLLSARELEEDVKRIEESIRENYLEQGTNKTGGLFDQVSEETAKHIEKILKEE
ncbi:translation factor GTPase family protein [Anaerosporobacter faecicola]|uniref:translation factor GTPase family protein n=1 Tax=Anaerosporobacter faecicola TaxID=2718714 RepID=UPI001438AA37|nr:TetM/TetW/TetO/TetS family tetracycline resistance ribosomal protection protein [Anaerosporobacter faecicola]